MAKKYTVILEFNAKNFQDGLNKFISFCRDEDIEILEDTFIFRMKRFLTPLSHNF